MRWTRRRWLTLAATTSLGACANTPTPSPDHIVDTATGRTLTWEDVSRRLRGVDIALLGELHDNPRHHARRAQLLAGFDEPVSVVVEHLPRGAEPQLRAEASGEMLRQTLEDSGFDAKGWRWPLHEPLFLAIARGGHRLSGGNLDREAAHRLARDGLPLMPADLAAWVEAAPLSIAGRAALEQDLRRGHCGQLSPTRTPGLVAAQRGRDAAMAQVLLSHLARVRLANGVGPVILLAGNGHVRRDHGVPVLLSSRTASARILSVGFMEPETSTTPADLPYDIAWTTPMATSDDPCKAWPMPRAGSA